MIPTTRINNFWRIAVTPFVWIPKNPAEAAFYFALNRARRLPIGFITHRSHLNLMKTVLL